MATALPVPTFDLYIVPDYVCSGVVEHYVKVSGVIRFPNVPEMDIFSVIINKKTGKMQRQSRVRKVGTIRQMSTIVFGQGYKKCEFARGPKDYAEFVMPKLGYDTRRLVTGAVRHLRSAMNHVIYSDAQMTADMIDGMKSIMDRVNSAYDNALNGIAIADEVGKSTVIAGIPDNSQTAGASTAVAMNDDWEPLPDSVFDIMKTEDVEEILNLIRKSEIENGRGKGTAIYNGMEYRFDRQSQRILQRPARREEGEAMPPVMPGQVSEIVRRSVMMARMANAGAMTEFVDGNLYRIKESAETDMNGMKYILLYNEAGEERWVNKSKVQLVKVFTEPPEQKQGND